jgi:hypothetical protein
MLSTKGGGGWGEGGGYGMENYRAETFAKMHAKTWICNNVEQKISATAKENFSCQKCFDQCKNINTYIFTKIMSPKKHLGYTVFPI